MLIGFLGIPCSGKTTTAARVFAHLKEMGVPSEFIPEYARIHIAEQRYDNIVASRDPKVVLLDKDQEEIATQQFIAETVMTTSCGEDVVVVTDSAVINSLLYMSEGLAKSERMQVIVTAALKRYDILFLCSRDTMSVPVTDPNRIHGASEMAALNDRLDALIESLGISQRVVFLDGAPQLRMNRAVSAVLDMRSLVP